MQSRELTQVQVQLTSNLLTHTLCRRRFGNANNCIFGVQRQTMYSRAFNDWTEISLRVFLIWFCVDFNQTLLITTETNCFSTDSSLLFVAFGVCLRACWISRASISPRTWSARIHDASSNSRFNRQRKTSKRERIRTSKFKWFFTLQMLFFTLSLLLSQTTENVVEKRDQEFIYSEMCQNASENKVKRGAK